MDLEALRFKVETSELDTAAQKLQSLATALQNAGVAVEQVSKQSDNLQKQQKKQQETSGKIVEDTKKQKQATVEAADSMSAAEKIVDKYNTKVDLLRSGTLKLADSTLELGKGFTSSQAATLSTLKVLGAAPDLINSIVSNMRDLNAFSSAKPFDPTVAGLEKLRKEAEELGRVNEYMARGFGLTKDQIMGLARDTVALTQQFNQAGKTTTELDAAIAKLEKDTVAAAQGLNALKQAAGESDRIAKEQASAELARAESISQANAAQRKAFEDRLQINAWKADQDEKNYKQDMQSLRAYYSALEKEGVDAEKSLKSINDKLVKDKQEAADQLALISQRIAKEQATTQYLNQGASRSTANVAAGMQVKGIPQEVIDSFVKEANAKEKAAKAAREVANANTFLIDIEERLKASLDQTNVSMDRQSTDELVKIKRALSVSGMAAEDATAKYAQLETMLRKVSSKEQSVRLEHLARAVSVQLGDVGISLASGMNPFLVMIQQGDQIRNAVMQAGASTKEMQNVMSTALGQIANSFMQVGQIMGSFFVGSIKQVGQVIADFVKSPMVLLQESYKQATTGAGDVSGAMKNLGASALSMGKIVGGGVVAGFVLLATAMYQTMQAETELSKSLISNAAYLGATKQELVDTAMQMKILGATSNDIIKAFTEIAKAGNISKDMMQQVTTAALELERVGGRAASETVKQLSKVSEDPVKALSDYRIATGLVSQEEMLRIEGLIEMGNRIGAVTEAQKIMASGASTEAQRILADLTPVQELWLLVKDTISDAWDEIVKIGGSKTIIEPVKVVFQTLAVIAAEFWYVLKGTATTMAGLAAIATNPMQAGTIWDQMGKDSAALAAQNKDTVDSIMKLGKYSREETDKTAKAEADRAKQNSDQERARLDHAKAMKPLKDFEKKNLAETLTKEAFITKQMEETLKVSKDLTESEQKRFKAMFASQWEDENKKNKPKKSEAEKEAERIKKYYDRLIEGANNAKASSEGMSEGLNKYQIKLKELENDDYFGKLTAKQQQHIKQLYAEAAAQEDLNIIRKLYNSTFDKTNGLGAEYTEQLKVIERIGSKAFSPEELEKFKQALYEGTQQFQDLNRLREESRKYEATLKQENQQLEFQKNLIGATAEEQAIANRENDRQLAYMKATSQLEAQLASIRAAKITPDQANAQTLEAQRLYLESLNNINLGVQIKQLNEFSDSFRILIESIGNMQGSLSGVFGSFGEDIGKAAKSFAVLQANSEKYKRQLEEVKGDQEKYSKLTRKANIQEMQDYANVAGAVKGFFKEKTTAYKAFSVLEKGFHVASLAMKLAESVADEESLASKLATNAASMASDVAAAGVSATKAVINAIASLPFPLNIAAGAATAAVVGALLASIGGSMSGMSGGGGSVKATNEGTGTVFGDSTAKSESLAKSEELLSEANSLTQKYTPQMLLHLRNIDLQMSGLTNLIIRTGDVQKASAGLGINVGSEFSSLVGKTVTSITQPVLDLMNKIPTVVAKLESGVVGKLVNGIAGGLFGKTSTSISGEGLTGEKQTLGSIMQDQFQGQYYTDVKIKKKSWFSSSTKYRTYLTDASEELEQQVTKVFEGIYNSVLAASKSLGQSETLITQALDSFVVDIGKVNLQGTGSEIQERLSAVFGAAADDIARAAMPGLEKFQAVGEGYFETLVRVSSQLESVNSMFDMMGVKLLELGVSGVEASQAVINLFGGISEFQSVTSEYYDSFYTEQEKISKKTEQLNTVFAELGLTVPAITGNLQESLNAYRDMVNALDLTDAAQQETYYALMQLSSAFYDVASAANSSFASVEQLLEGLYSQTRSNEDIANSIYDLRNETAMLQATYDDLISGASGVNSAVYKLTTEGMHPLEKAAYDQKIAIQARIDAEKAARQSAIDTAKAREDAIKSAFSVFETAINNQKTLIQTSINNLQKLFDVLKNSVTQLYGSVSSTVSQGANEARKFIASAITTATNTGALPESEAIQDAITSVMQGMEATVYASKSDADKARLKFAAELSTLQAMVEPKLTEAEQQLKILENTYTTAKAQLSMLGQIDNSVLTVAQAIANLNRSAGTNIAVPAFASGGSYQGGLALVGEQGPELINFSQPGTVMNATKTAEALSANTGVAEQIGYLRQEVVMLRAEVRADVQHNAKTAKILDRVAQDGNAFNVNATMDGGVV